MEYSDPKRSLEIKVEFLGAVGGVVTGSGTIVTVRRGSIKKNILIDFGAFQGEDEYRNVERVIVPEEIDYVLLTHAHLDHCGAIPMLYKSVGDRLPYMGKVFGSAETLSQAKHIIKDAAILNRKRLDSKIAELREVEHTVKKETNRIHKKDASYKELSDLDSLNGILEEVQEEIPYLPEDAEEAFQHFRSVPMNLEISLCEGIDIKFIPNSHINGSTMIEIYATYGAEHLSIAFSGDVGKRKTLLYKEMVYPKEPNIDILVLESLHGTQEPEETYADSIRTLKKIIKKAIKEQKNVYIPVFALDRSAAFLMIMNQLMDYGMHFNCFFDSPLGERELEAYMRAYNTGTSEWFDYDKKEPFRLERIDFADGYDGHMRIVKREGPNVVLTSSCMGYGGRVLDYFDQHIQDEDAIFVFPGYLPDDCPSKLLCETEKGKMLEMNGRKYIKHCETYHLNGCSSHGYFEDKLEIIERYCNASTIMLNHGDNQSLCELEQALLNKTDKDIVVPELNIGYYFHTKE